MLRFVLSCNHFSCSLISSPVKDLLEKPGGCSLEELLEEVELLQEVRGNNELLITFMSRESTISQMLQYAVGKPALGATKEKEG
jgi:hypothetical protein